MICETAAMDGDEQRRVLVTYVCDVVGCCVDCRMFTLHAVVMRNNAQTVCERE